MPISQSDMSKIFSGKKVPNLYQCAAVCKALNMSMDFLVWGEDGHREDFCDTHNAETLHDTGRELKWYLGEYSFYYLSTASSEDKILKGELTIEQGKEFCIARMIINIDKRNEQGEWVYKEYSGRILVSSSLGGISYFKERKNRRSLHALFPTQKLYGTRYGVSYCPCPYDKCG